MQVKDPWRMGALPRPEVQADEFIIAVNQEKFRTTFTYLIVFDDTVGVESP